MEDCEIAAYSGLIETGRALGETEAIGLLEENVRRRRRLSARSSRVTKRSRDETKASVS
jgi:ferritin-like metal-binding protein YciE